MTESRQRLAAIFNEWARRYAEDPEAFDDLLDADGNPVQDYGDRCALYFAELENDLFPSVK